MNNNNNISIEIENNIIHKWFKYDNNFTIYIRNEQNNYYYALIVNDNIVKDGVVYV